MKTSPVMGTIDPRLWERNLAKALEHNELCAMVWIGDHSYHALVDTGAVISLIRSKCRL